MQGQPAPVTEWWSALKRGWMLYHLGDPRFRFMWDTPPPDEWVALDCETTGLDTRRDDIVAIDTGCLWGGKLTAVRFPDRRIYQEDCPCWADPFKYK